MVERGKNIGISKMFFAFNLDGSRILDFGIDSSLGSVIDPLTNKYLIFFTEEIRPLSFSFIVDPVSFEVISTSFGEYTVSTAFAHVPHTLVDVSIRVYHASLAVRLIVHPHTVVSVSTLIEHGSSTLLGIVLPVTCVLSSQFVFGVCYPISALSVTFVVTPSSFVFISIRVILNAEAILLVIAPVSDVLMRTYPSILFFGTVLIEGLFLIERRGTLTQYMLECAPFFCALESFFFQMRLVVVCCWLTSDLESEFFCMWFKLYKYMIWNLI